jgi:uncharacterized membrane protein/thiol-disulfide isomerase/thioredoxin
LRRWTLSILSLILLFFTFSQPAFAESPTVKAILFYSPTCPHCHKVVTEDLPPLLDKYGDQLEIVGVDVSTPGGQALYQAAIEQFSIPSDRWGVPTLVIGDVVLVGDLEIPEQLPGLIDAGFAQGGIDWPEIPGLREALGEMPQATAPAPATPMENFQRDPVGNGLSVIVLFGMAVSLAAVVASLLSRRPRLLSAKGRLTIPYLAVLGAAISGYLAYVEWTGNPVACGPIGDCNAVQDSPEAILFGLIPVAWLGVMGYAAILVVWIYGRRQGGRTESLSAQAILAMAVLGTGYSIYLTYLEPFVIGATCAWCLASAIIMTIILWAAYGPAVRAIRRTGSRPGTKPRRAPTG